MLTAVFSVPVPLHDFDSVASVHVLFPAPGYSGANPCASPAASAIPLRLVGAAPVQDQAAGQFALPDAPHEPLSRSSTATVEVPTVQFIVICGSCSPAAQFVRDVRKVAVHPFAALGVWIRVTDTPA